MATVTITKKRQITIPSEICSLLRLQAGDKVELIIKKNHEMVLVPLTSDIRKLKSILPKLKKVVTLAQMNKAISKRAARK